MAIDFNDPEVQEAIKLQATKIAEETINENYVPITEIEGLKNKNSELLGKLAKQKERFNGVDEKDIAELQRVKSAREHDRFVDMVLNGKTEEAKAIATEGAIEPWKNKASELENQFKTAQERINQYETELSSYQDKVSTMQKRTYLRDLTGKDDSFKGDYFEDFFALNANKMEIDQETGKVLALDASGKAVLDTNGERVSYSDYYDKMKVTNGLFWNGGSGSGSQGSAGAPAGGDPMKWTDAQKQEFIREKGPKAYGELLARSRK